MATNNEATEDQATGNEEITNDEIMEAFAQGRGLLAGCPIRPETPDDRPEMRSEWTHGSVAPNIYCGTTSGTAEERAVDLWRFLSE